MGVSTSLAKEERFRVRDDLCMGVQRDNVQMIGQKPIIFPSLLQTVTDIFIKL